MTTPAALDDRAQIRAERQATQAERAAMRAERERNRRDARLEARAASLPIRRVADSVFVVASGSEPGRTYRVVAPAEALPRHYRCECVGRLAYCSHKRAARMARERGMPTLAEKTKRARTPWIEEV